MASHGHSSHSEEKEIPAPQTAAIWKTFWILLILTAIEFIIAFTLPANGIRVAIFAGMTIVKAFYIVGEFMHLKHEVKNLIMTIVVPLLLFVWFIGAFLWDGSSFRNLRNNYNPYFKEQATIKVEKKVEEHKATDAKHEAAATKHETVETTHEATKPEVEPYLAQFPQHELVAVGSSLKFCLVAEGSAHIYPRFGPTMLWDTGAGHIIATAAGASVLYDGIEGPAYQRENLRNGNFVVRVLESVDR